MARYSFLRALVFLQLTACFSSGAGEDPVPGICCDTDCSFSDGNICGLTNDPDFNAPFCQSQDLVSPMGALVYSNCDESGDCPANEVCRASPGGNYYACQQPLDCAAPSEGCDYACRYDSECPLGASRCVASIVTEGACDSVGFCRAAP